MAALEKNGKEALGERCRRIIKEKYSLEGMVGSYVQLWRDTLADFEPKAIRKTDTSIVKVVHVIAGLNVGGAELSLKRLVELHINNPRLQPYCSVIESDWCGWGTAARIAVLRWWHLI